MKEEKLQNMDKTLKVTLEWEIKLKKKVRTIQKLMVHFNKYVPLKNYENTKHFCSPYNVLCRFKTQKCLLLELMQ